MVQSIKEVVAFTEPQRIAQLMHSYTGTWAIAGGWAIDLFLNKSTRKHLDIEVFILREELLLLRTFLAGWQLKFVSAGKLMDWNRNTYLDLPIHEIQGHNSQGEVIEVLLNERVNGHWQFRRNPLIASPMDQVIVPSALGIHSGVGWLRY